MTQKEFLAKLASKKVKWVLRPGTFAQSKRVIRSKEGDRCPLQVMFGDEDYMAYAYQAGLRKPGVIMEAADEMLVDAARVSMRRALLRACKLEEAGK